MICHKSKYIFIHIPKTAGTTVREYLMKMGVANSQRTSGLPNMNFLQNIAQVVNLYPNYFTFSFVRNPFDRFVSYYMHGLRKNKEAIEKGVINTLPYTTMRECIDLTLELREVGKGYIPSRYAMDIDKKIGAHKTPFNKLYFEEKHSKEQTKFLLDYNPKTYFGVKRFNNASCDFIARFENFDTDFANLLDILNLPQTPYKLHHISKDRLLNNKRRHYSHYYNNETKKLVEEMYARDLEHLGYEFEQEAKVSILNPFYKLEQAKARYQKKISTSLKTYSLQICLFLYLKRIRTFIEIEVKRKPFSRLIKKYKARVLNVFIRNIYKAKALVNKFLRKENVAMLTIGRCGSLVLQKMLGQHSNMVWDGEIFNYLSFYKYPKISSLTQFIHMHTHQKISRFYGFVTKYLPAQLSKTTNLDLAQHIALLRENNFGKFIVLHRKNYLRHLISIHVARKLKEYHLKESLTSAVKVNIDVNDAFIGKPLLEHFKSIDRQYEQLKNNLKNDIALYLTYEDDILENPRIAYKKVCTFLGVAIENPKIIFKRTNVFSCNEMLENFAEIKTILINTPYEWMLYD